MAMILVAVIGKEGCFIFDELPCGMRIPVFD